MEHISGGLIWDRMRPNKRVGTGVNDAPPGDISGWGNIAGFRDTDNITIYDMDQDGQAGVFLLIMI